MILRCISGGQTGVDRAALDAAMSLGIEVGGFCPQGRLAEDGVIPNRYPLWESKVSVYPSRTKANIKEANATLILVTKPEDLLSGGTALTIRICGEEMKLRRRRYLIAYLGVDGVEDFIGNFVRAAVPECGTLNVAGPREKKCPGVYQKAFAVMSKVLKPYERQSNGD